MENKTKQEIILNLVGNNYNKYSFKDLLVFYDNKNLYCVIEYKNSPITYNNLPIICIDFLKEIKKLFGEEIAICLYNLFYDIRRRFSKFHITHNPPKEQLHYLVSILCSKKDFQIVKKTINLIISQDKHSKKNWVNYLVLNDFYLISTNIPTFYHLLNPGLFSWRNKIRGCYKSPSIYGPNL